MRKLTLSISASVLLLVLPLPLAAAEESFNCHSWEVLVGSRENGVGLSPDDGAVYVAAAGNYAVSDGDPVRNPWIFSIWLGQEMNGEPGFQRSDEVCDETDGGMSEPDCFLCCLCFNAPPALPKRLL